MRVNLDAVEAEGGALAGAVGLITTQPFNFSAHANGSPTAARSPSIAHTGAQTPSTPAGPGPRKAARPRPTCSWPRPA